VAGNSPKLALFWPNFSFVAKAQQHQKTIETLVRLAFKPLETQLFRDKQHKNTRQRALPGV
jgi:hypothetical protein